MIKTIFCDLDDTLIANHYAYYIPQLDAVKMIVADLEEFSPPPSQIIEMTTHYQVENIIELGYISKICFPNSFLRTYRELCSQAGRQPNNDIESAIVVITTKYLLTQYKLYPNVKEALDSIEQTKILVTRGISEIQDYKIDNVGLRPFFSHIEVVPEKIPKTYLDLLIKYNLKAEETMMIGDSIRNDIVPALEAGLKAVQVYTGIIQWDWENKLGPLAELHRKFEFPVIKTFSEIVNYLG